MGDEIDVSGWPYTGERYESDYGFGSGCTCSKCMAEYEKDAKAQHNKYAPHYTNIKRPALRPQSVDQRITTMANEHDKTFGTGSWPFYYRPQAETMENKPTLAQSLSDVNIIIVFFFLILVMLVYQAKSISELKYQLKLLAANRESKP